MNGIKDPQQPDEPFQSWSSPLADSVRAWDTDVAPDVRKKHPHRVQPGISAALHGPGQRPHGTQNSACELRDTDEGVCVCVYLCVSVCVCVSVCMPVCLCAYLCVSLWGVETASGEG